jgi:hypothetical protein
MDRKLTPIFIVVSLMVVLSLACSLSGGSSGNKQAKPTATKAQSATKSGITLGEEFRSEGGGFAFKKVPGYEFTETIGILQMLAPDGNLNTGPGIVLMGGLNEVENTNEQILEKLMQDTKETTFAQSKSIVIDGVKGLSVEMSGTYQGDPIKGKMVVVMVSPKQQFTLMAFSPSARWNEIKPVVEAVVSSVTFFEANPEAVAAATEPLPEPTLEMPTKVPTKKPAALPTSKPDTSGSDLIRQWARYAVASSQYGEVNWAASQATGAPNVEECGDNGLAWASQKYDTVEWIELTYAIPVKPTQIEIHQSYNPSQVAQVDMITTDGSVYTVVTEVPQKVSFCPDVYSIDLELDKDILVDRIRITIDQGVLGLGWNEIDAVELVGIR